MYTFCPAPKRRDKRPCTDCHARPSGGHREPHPPPRNGSPSAFPARSISRITGGVDSRVSGGNRECENTHRARERWYSEAPRPPTTITSSPAGWASTQLVAAAPPRCETGGTLRAPFALEGWRSPPIARSTSIEPAILPFKPKTESGCAPNGRTAHARVVAALHTCPAACRVPVG